MTRHSVLQICHGYKAPFLDVARQYARLCQDNGWQVTTLFLKGSEDEGIRQALTPGEVRFLDLDARAMRGIKAGTLRHLQRLLQSRGYSLVIAHRFKPVYLALWAGLFGPSCPVVGTLHDFGVMSRWRRKMSCFLYRRRLLLLGVSDAVRDDARQDLAAYLPASAIGTLYNALDVQAARTALLDRLAARRQLGFEPQHIVVANVARLHSRKDQVTLLRAFAAFSAEVPAARLALFGSGRAESELRELARQSGIEGKVVFFGFVPDVSRLYRAFDLFVLSSLREPFGIVLLEAMLAGVPVICSRAGGAPEVVGDNGYLFDTGDSTALHRRLQQVNALDAGAREELAQKMMARLQTRFTCDAVAQSFHTQLAHRFPRLYE